MFEELRGAGYQVDFKSHAKAILAHDFPDAEKQLTKALLPLSIPVSELIESGGGEARVTQRLRNTLTLGGWPKRMVTIRKIIDDHEKESVTHEIDHVRDFPNGMIALEIEWNNKDPFFDRDLENFKRLHAEGVFSVGVIITRGESFQSSIRSIALQFARDMQVNGFADFPAGLDYRPSQRFRNEVEARVAASGRPFAEVWAERFCSDKYGQATTHWSKLELRVKRGVGNPCPLVMIGIPASVVAGVQL